MSTCTALVLTDCVLLHYRQNVLPGHVFMLEELCFAADGGEGEEVLRSQLRLLIIQLGMGKKHLLLHASTYRLA